MRPLVMGESIYAKILVKLCIYSLYIQNTYMYK